MVLRAGSVGRQMKLRLCYLPAMAKAANVSRSPDAPVAAYAAAALRHFWQTFLPCGWAAIDTSGIQPPLQRLVLNLNLRSSKGRKMSGSGDFRPNPCDNSVIPSLKQRHAPASSKPIKNLASASQQGRQRGFCLGGSSSDTAANPSVLQAPNRPTAPAGSNGSGSGDHSMGHLATDQCGGCCSGYFATKPYDNIAVYAKAVNSNGRRTSIFRTDRLPLRDNL